MCFAAVKGVLEAIDGVSGVDAVLEDGIVIFDYDTLCVNPSILKDTV